MSFNKVTTIGGYAFNDCNGIASVTIPSTVTSIGSNSFGSIDSLKTVTFEGTSEPDTCDTAAFASSKVSFVEVDIKGGKVVIDADQYKEHRT